MEEEVADLRKQLAQAEARLAEEQRQREEEQRKSQLADARAADERRWREEEQHRRELAEAEAEKSQPNTLIEYLKACHELSLALEVVTDATSTTQGDTTKPAGRPFPRRIVPWSDFPTLQEKIWEKLSSSPSFTSQRVYPSTHQLDYVQRYLDPIGSELGLRHHARDTVENPVRTLIAEVYGEQPLRERLRLEGMMMFESHTNLPQLRETSIEQQIEHMSVTESNVSQTRGAKGKGKQGDKKSSQGPTSGRRRAGNADQFCIYEMSDGQRIPVVSIEYKPPHKLPLAQIIAGLKGEIRPAEEVINKEGDGFDFLSKSLVAAVITQLYSYMLRKGIQWGYIFVGKAIIFLYIPDDPTIVYYHLSIPQLDFQEDDENRFHRTSVAQIFAFCLNSLSTEAPSQLWHDRAATIDTWAIEYIDILKKIPETERKEAREIAYKPSRWKGFIRSPIRTRSHSQAAVCSNAVNDRVQDNSGDESGDSNTPPTPTPKRTTGVRRGDSGKSTAQRHKAQTGKRKMATKHSNGKETTLGIKNRPFCTQQCLRGLACGGDLDDQCPNVRDHRGRHIASSIFLSLIRTQLASDRGRGADCKPLHMKGSRGALFKIRLSSHGYTLVAKGMEKVERKYLIHESKIYDHLRPIQGSCIPVSLGMVDLEFPYYYDGGIYFSMLFLSWSGQSIHQCLTRTHTSHILDQVDRTFEELHRRQVLHKDVEPRNLLWDEKCSNLMLVDFERAEIRSRPPLGAISPNRKRDIQGKSKSNVNDDDEFYCEVQKARASISQCTR